MPDLVAGTPVQLATGLKPGPARTLAPYSSGPLQVAVPGPPGSGSGSSTWEGLDGKPSTFPPSDHDHAIADVTGLTDALAGKQSTGSYEASGAAAAAVTAHTEASNPHPQYLTPAEADAAYATAAQGELADSAVQPGDLPAPTIHIGTAAPTLATGDQALWLDTTGGNLSLNLVTGD